MELLIALQPMTGKSGGIIKPGEIIQSKYPERLLTEGKVRRLTRPESRDILDRYVQEAREVFKVEGPLVYYGCRGKDFWTSVHGVIVCRRCHPRIRNGLTWKENI